MFKSTSMGTLSLTLVLIALALGIGVGIGYVAFEPQSTEAASTLDASQERVARLEASIAEKDSRYQELLDQVADFKEEVALTTATNENLMDEIKRQGEALAAAEAAQRGLQVDLTSTQRQVRALETQIGGEAALTSQISGFTEALVPLADDRLLLVELRKDTPDTLEEATEYWETVKELAVAADPTLGAKVDRVIQFLPTYFEWFEGEYTDTCESLQAFFDTGAVEFGTLSGDLQSDVFLLLINRIDVATGLVEN
ncbi:MAG: hypothetical protein OXC99_08120 [Chloroflexi bacterium]|nr:hypothetical protein [Chloroflexota bacterium]